MKIHFSFTVACVLLKLTVADVKLQILHVSDMHARFLETDVHSLACPDDLVMKNKCYGGFARVRQMTMNAREEAAKQNITSIFINAGDTFLGTPFYTIEKWQICAELVAQLEFDIMTVGNHEFDDGINNLVNFLTYTDVPTVCSNLNISSEMRLNISLLHSSYIMTINNTKIGFLGYLTQETMYTSYPENLKILPEIPLVRAEAKRLKAAGVNIIIAIGHSGINVDVEIAKEIEEISLIVGGHTHALMHTPTDQKPSIEIPISAYPMWVTNKSGRKIPIVHSHAYTKYLGRLLVEFDEAGNVLNAAGNTVLLDGSIKKEPKIDASISIWAKSIREKVRTIKGYTRTHLGIARISKGIFESSLANLITDAMIDIGVQYAFDHNVTGWTSGAIALYQNGGIRAEISPERNNGALTVEDLMTIVPFDDKLVLITLPGETIRRILETNVEDYGQNLNKMYRGGYFISFSGMRVVYNLNKRPGRRAEIIEVLCSKCLTPKYEPLRDDQYYNVFTVTYLSNGGDKFEMIPKQTRNLTYIGISDLEVLVRYLEKQTYIYPKLDKRIIVYGFEPYWLQTSSAYSITAPNIISFMFIILITFLML